MHKWIKRTLLIAALLLALAALFLGGGFALLKGTPAFYRPIVMTDAERKAAADAAEDTLARIQNFAADARRETVLETRTTTTISTLPSTDDKQTFSFTQDQLNALFNKWADLYGWREPVTFAGNSVLCARLNRRS